MSQPVEEKSAEASEDKLRPYDARMLDVGDGHWIYVEEVGRADGIPALFLHGGPGSGSQHFHRALFDPNRFRAVLLDQRGSGRSHPHLSLEANTTPHLIADLERIREHFGIERWFLVGGSWGSTLALAYAQTHPERVSELVLRGIFMLRRSELVWFYQQGCDALFPDAWEEYLKPIPEVERGDLMSAYHRRLTGSDPQARLAAARAWSIWEGATSFLLQDSAHIASSGEDEFALAFARIECHYFVNGGFFAENDQLLRNAHRLRAIPSVIVQGRYDVCCPMRSAWDLHRAWPEADLRIVADAGHSAFEPGITHELIAATDRFR